MLVLASTSQRRKELLQSVGIDFVVQTPLCNENIDPSLRLDRIATHLAERKIVSVKDRLVGKAQEANCIVAADTFIALDGEYYGKPKDRSEAAEFLKRFAGRTHGVLSGISVYNRKTMKMFSKTVKSNVSIARLTDSEIEGYLDTNEWVGAAGGYRIQGKGALLVTHIVGSYSAIVGLPLETLFDILKLQGEKLF